MVKFVLEARQREREPRYWDLCQIKEGNLSETNKVWFGWWQSVLGL